MNFRNPGTGSRGGRRKDLGIYLRSSWESNYARYLNLAVERGYITSWRYEPIEFQFHRINKGTRFYTPDFEVKSPFEGTEYHEVKGYLTPKAKTQLNRMKRYYPNVRVKLIGKKEYKEIKEKFSQFIPEWEDD